jgi:hypothetical protein
MALLLVVLSVRSAPPPEVPDWLSESTKEGLEKERNRLIERLDQIEKIGKEYNDAYAGKPDNIREAPEARQMFMQLENDKKSYLADLANFKEHLATAVTAEKTRLLTEIARLKNKVAMDLSAIRHLGFDKRAEDYQEWLELDAAARKQLREQASKSLADLLLTAAQDANKAVIQSIGSLNTFSAQKLIGKLKAANIKDPRVWELVNEIGATNDKPAMRKATLKLLELVEREGDVIGGGSEIVRDPENIPLQGETAATILSWGLEGPLAGWFASETELCISTIYTAAATNVSRKNIERLNSLTDAQLVILKGLNQMVEDHVKALRKLEITLSNLDKH